jgi:Protein of unknown function (DUF1353)
VDEAAKSLDRQTVEIAGSRLPAPLLSYLGHGEWRLERDYMYRDRATRIRIPAGFVFDLSSVPRPFWSLIAPFELSIVAPLLHDVLYRHGGNLPPKWVKPPRTYTRAEVDRMFRRIMEAEEVSRWRRVLAYWAVRLFGRLAWRK